MSGTYIPYGWGVADPADISYSYIPVHRCRAGRTGVRICKYLVDLSQMDVCAGFPCDPVFCLFKQGNESSASRLGFCELNGSLYFREHGSGSKMSLFNIFSRFLRVKLIQPFFFRLSEVNGNLFHGGEYNEEIGIQIFRQQFACKVLIDYGAGSS